MSPDPNRPWMALLRPSRGGLLGESLVDPEVVAEIVLQVGEPATEWAIETACEMQSVQDVARLGGALLQATPRSAETELFGLWAIMVVSGRSHASTALFTRLVNGVIDSLPQMLSLEQSILGLQIAHGYFLDRLLEICSADEAGESAPAAMKQISSELHHGLRSLSAKLAQRFDAERGRWLSTSSAIKHETVLAILAGESIVDIDRASTRLSYDLRAEHIALTVWRHDSAEEEGNEPSLSSAAGQILHDLGCRGVLILPVHADHVWAWGRITVEDRPVISGLSVPNGVKTAVGLPARGVSGFRSSHSQAVEAERIARSGAAPPAAVFDFDALELFGILSMRPEALAAFVVRELGALARSAPGEKVLRETLMCYLENDRSLSAVASRLHIAKNTVLHRVRRSEQLRGRSVHENRLRLFVALYACEVLGAMGTEPRTDSSGIR